MTSFNEKLKKAVKSVLKDMGALSGEELRKEIRSYMSDQMTLALHYAMDYKSELSQIPENPQFNWDKIQTMQERKICSTFSAPSLFANEPIHVSCHGFQCEGKKLTSDDYLLFRAAA